MDLYDIDTKRTVFGSFCGEFGVYGERQKLKKLGKIKKDKGSKHCKTFTTSSQL